MGADQTVNYVLTLDQNTVTIAVPSTTPSFCKLFFSDELTLLNSGETAVVSTIPDGQTIDVMPSYNVFWNKDLTPVLPEQQSQRVTITGYAGSMYNPSTATVSDTLIIDVNFANPCVMPEHVYIEGPTLLADEDYIIDSPALPLTQHGPFSIVTVPNPHNLCGTINIEPKFNNAPLTDDPVTYDPINMRFIAESSNTVWITEGEGELRLCATLTLFPPADNPTAT